MSSNQETHLNQRYLANRWNTKVSLECWQSGSIRRLLWFSDLQDAYIWVREHTEQNREINWILRSFTAVARDLDERWNNGENGVTIAIGGSRKFRVQYEPEATEAALASGQRWPSATSEVSNESTTSTEENSHRPTRIRLTAQQVAVLNAQNGMMSRNQN